MLFNLSLLGYEMNLFFVMKQKELDSQILYVNMVHFAKLEFTIWYQRNL